MALLGSCHLCPRPALHACFLCGRGVCTLHYDGKTGTCEGCHGRKAARDGRLP